MKKIFLFLVLVYSITMTHAAANLQLDLESSYKNYLEAIHSNDAEKLRSTMSTHCYMKLKNIIASSKLKFPEDFILMTSSKAVNLKKERFLGAMEKASTANCVYYGKGFNYSKALLIIQFIKEDGQWKFDDIQEKSNEEIIKKIESKDIAFINKEYVPTGVVPATAKEITLVDYRGTINMQSEGYKVTVKINGITQEVKDNILFEELIVGGLKKGINYIEVRLVPINAATITRLKISIKSTVKNQVKEVFKYEDAKPSIIFMREFEIN